MTTRFSNRFWISAGASTFSLGTEPGSTRYTDRNYQIKTTPILNFGLGANRFAFLANLGNASTDSATVGIYDFKGTYEVLTMNYSAWSLIGSVGATFQQLNPSNQTGTTPLKTISTGGPAGELAAHYRLFNSVKAIGGGDFYYPALTSDQEGLQPLSYGWSLFAALRARVTSSFNIELGTRYRYFRLPVAGDNFGFQQRFLTIDLSLYWMF